MFINIAPSSLFLSFLSVSHGGIYCLLLHLDVYFRNTRTEVLVLPCFFSPTISYLSCLEVVYSHLMNSVPAGGPTAIISSCSDAQETSQLNSEYHRIVAALLPVEILSKWPTVVLQKSTKC